MTCPAREVIRTGTPVDVEPPSDWLRDLEDCLGQVDCRPNWAAGWIGMSNRADGHRLRPDGATGPEFFCDPKTNYSYLSGASRSSRTGTGIDFRRD